MNVKPDIVHAVTHIKINVTVKISMVLINDQVNC